LIVDHASGGIFLQHQVSLQAGDTLKTKKLFERWATQHGGVSIEKYHGDSGIFASAEFKSHLKLKGQTIDFSGTGAHHQNGVAKRSIKTIVEWARMMVLHAAIHWPERADLELWPFALEYAVYLWNNLPSQDSGLSPIEIFSQQKMPSYEHLRRAHDIVTTKMILKMVEGVLEKNRKPVVLAVYSTIAVATLLAFEFISCSQVMKRNGNILDVLARGMCVLVCRDKKDNNQSIGLGHESIGSRGFARGSWANSLLQHFHRVTGLQLHR